MLNQLLAVFQALALLLLAAAAAVAQRQQTSQANSRPGQVTPSADYHQHLFSPAITELLSSAKPITAQGVIGLLDAAGIRRGPILFVAYIYGRPGREPQDEYVKVRAENDWVGTQAALFPKRLIRRSVTILCEKLSRGYGCLVQHVTELVKHLDGRKTQNGRIIAKHTCSAPKSVKGSEHVGLRRPPASWERNES
jgi:hypothetical protein